MNIEKLKAQLIKHEGKRHFAYRCPANFLTIGVGRNLETKGLSDEEIDFLLERDIDESYYDCIAIFMDEPFEWGPFRKYSQSRQHALIDMRFNLGPARFRGFKKMITAVKAEDWETAAKEMENSKWYKQVGSRAVRLVEMMRDG